MSYNLVRTGNLPTWAINTTLCSNVYMTGLAILDAPGNCVTGFIFYYSDGSSKTIGTDYTEGSKPLVLNITDSYGLSNVNSYGGSIIDVLQICGGVLAECVSAGDNLGHSFNYPISIDQTWIITSFWGSFNEWIGGYACLENFGIDYYETSTYTRSKFIYKVFR